MFKRKLMNFALLLMLCFGITFQVTINTAFAQAKEHKLKILKVNNKWKVVHEEDITKVKIKAKRGEKIVWTASGSDMYFQFMDEKLFGNYTRTLKDGQKLVLPIGSEAKLGSHPYAVFCLTDKAFATGESPPTIIVE